MAKRQAALLKKLKAIEKGGDINAADKKKQTALMTAAAANNRLAVCWLVAKGADVTLKNTKGKKAYDLTKRMHIRSLLRACMDEKKPLDEEQKQGVSYWVRDIDVLCKGTETDSVNEVLGKCEEYTYMGHHYSLSLVQRYAGNLRGVKTLPHRTPESIAFLVRHGGSSPLPEELVELEPLVLRLLLALGEDAKANDNERKMQVALKTGSVADIKTLLRHY